MIHISQHLRNNLFHKWDSNPIDKNLIDYMYHLQIIVMHKLIHSNMYAMDIDMYLYLKSKLHIDFVDMLGKIDYKLMNKEAMKYEQYQQVMLTKTM
jgi:hypothetical protein